MNNDKESMHGHLLHHNNVANNNSTHYLMEAYYQNLNNPCNHSMLY